MLSISPVSKSQNSLFNSVVYVAWVYLNPTSFYSTELNRRLAICLLCFQMGVCLSQIVIIYLMDYSRMCSNVPVPCQSYPGEGREVSRLSSLQLLPRQMPLFLCALRFLCVASMF